MEGHYHRHTKWTCYIEVEKEEILLLDHSNIASSGWVDDVVIVQLFKQVITHSNIIPVIRHPVKIFGCQNVGKSGKFMVFPRSSDLWEVYWITAYNEKYESRVYIPVGLLHSFTLTSLIWKRYETISSPPSYGLNISTCISKNRYFQKLIYAIFNPSKKSN